ncbi:MAG: ISKra4 family transposase [Planctomycetota bacterium]|jgi:hypothetical protein
MDTKILEELEAAYSEELNLLVGDLGALEQAVGAKMHQLGQGLLQRLVQRRPNGYKGSSLFCNCGGSKRFVGHRSKNIHTIFGWIKIERAYYHCRHCGLGLAPYDLDSGLGPGQLSAGLAKACCLLAVDDSFEQTSRKIEQLFGQKVSPNTIDRLTHRVGSVLLQQEDKEVIDFQRTRQIPKAQIAPKRLYIGADGTTVHETDGWHESKLGVIYWEDGCRHRSSHYVGRFDNSEIFGWHLWLQACRCGLRQGDEVVFLGDGAPWIRHEKRRHFGRATFIIDWYHASEHVWDCGKVLFGEGSKAAEKWVKQRENWLWDGRTRELLNDLQKQQKQYRGRRRKELAGLYQYIRTNEEEMRYDVFRGKGYDIGSGAVEGACKCIVGKRLKQSGMIWTRTGSSAILALRIAWLNQKWEQLWQMKPLAA